MQWFIAVLVINFLFHEDLVESVVISHRNSRIVGGNMAVEGQFPWMVSIISCTPEGKPLATCGGSLISDRHVLTAAHCTAGRKKWSIGMGSLRLSIPVLHCTSVETIIHPNYDSTYLTNDIALLILPASVELNKNVHPIKLASSTIGSLEERIAMVSGFGETNDNQIYKLLKFANMKITSQKECLKVYSRAFIKPTTLCAVGAEEDQPTTCNGDSGSPLIIKEGDSYIQVGVVSFTYKTCVKGIPSGYVRVSSYIDWIKENTGISV